MIAFLYYFLPFVPLILSVSLICIEHFALKNINIKTKRILLTVFIAVMFLTDLGCIVTLSIVCDVSGGWQRYVMLFGAFLYFAKNILINN